MKKIILSIFITLSITSCTLWGTSNTDIDSELYLGTITFLEVKLINQGFDYETTIVLDNHKKFVLCGRWYEIKVGMCMFQVPHCFLTMPYAFRKCDNLN